MQLYIIKKKIKGFINTPVLTFPHVCLAYISDLYFKPPLDGSKQMWHTHCILSYPGLVLQAKKSKQQQDIYILALQQR